MDIPRDMMMTTETKPLEYYEIVDNAIELQKQFLPNDPKRNVLDWKEFIKLTKIYKSLINRSSSLNNARKKMKEHSKKCSKCEKIFMNTESRFNNILAFIKTLGPSIIACKYRYGKRNMWVTPQWKQITENYLTILNKLHKIDTGIVDPKSINSEDLKKIENNLKNCELLNKSIKEQTQGRRSFIKQEASPGRHYFTFRCTVLPSTFDMDIDEIGIPYEIFPGILENSNRMFVSLIFKRDPVICQYSIHTPEKIKRVSGRCLFIHPFRYKSMNLDIDGDTVVVNICISEAVSLELLIRLNCHLSMYVYFAKTRMEFSQTHALRLHDPRIIDTLMKHSKWGKIFKYVYNREFNSTKTINIFNHFILILVQLYDSATAYDFMDFTNKIAFENKCLETYFVRDLVDDYVCNAIVDSGAKGSYDVIEIMKNMPQQMGDIEKETLSYAQKYIGNNNAIAKVWQTETQLLQSLQNIIVESNLHLSLNIANKKIDLGPVDNFMPHFFKMDQTVALLIDDEMF